MCGFKVDVIQARGSVIMNKFAAVTALMLVSGIAAASQGKGGFDWDKGNWGKGGFDWDSRPGTFQAPEIDPASTMSALTLLAGGLVVLRGRFSKK
jgi:uncharacterized protein YdeI (BOF family)